MTIDTRHETRTSSSGTTRARRGRLAALARRAWAANTAYADAWQRYARPRPH